MQPPSPSPLFALPQRCSEARKDWALWQALRTLPSQGVAIDNLSLPMCSWTVPYSGTFPLSLKRGLWAYLGVTVMSHPRSSRQQTALHQQSPKTSHSFLFSAKAPRRTRQKCPLFAQSCFKLITMKSIIACKFKNERLCLTTSSSQAISSNHIWQKSSSKLWPPSNR